MEPLQIALIVSSGCMSGYLRLSLLLRENLWVSNGESDDDICLHLSPRYFMIVSAHFHPPGKVQENCMAKNAEKALMHLFDYQGPIVKYLLSDPL